MLDPQVQGLIPSALGMILYLLQHRKQSDEAFTFPRDVEFCLELRSLTTPPEFNYYIVDHKNQTVFWADDRQPAVIERTEEDMRGA